jgi:hypothetical protein
VIYGGKTLSAAAPFIRSKAMRERDAAPPGGARTLWFTHMTIEKLSCDSFMTIGATISCPDRFTVIKNKWLDQYFDSEWFLIALWR